MTTKSKKKEKTVGATKKSGVIDLNNLDVQTIVLVLRDSVCSQGLRFVHYGTDLRGAYDELASSSEMPDFRRRLGLTNHPVPKGLVKAMLPFFKFDDTTNGDTWLDDFLSRNVSKFLKPSDSDFDSFLKAVKDKVRETAKSYDLKVIG